MPTLTLPNYTSCPESPSIEDMGVQIKMTVKSFKQSQPVVLHGAYKINQQLIRRAQGAPLTRIVLLVVRRDELGIWTNVVQDGSNIIPLYIPHGAKDDPKFREGGYFNIDLKQMCELLNQPGKYWVMASMDDYASDRIEFEILTER
ncbi:MAG: hypothetical protein QME52_05010 [Bacteroidota bacterium]|nr:hypothetical protein [Bacteroidota bacterium]